MSDTPEGIAWDAALAISTPPPALTEGERVAISNARMVCASNFGTDNHLIKNLDSLLTRLSGSANADGTKGG